MLQKAKATQKKYYLKTFGCQSNMADSDRIRGILESIKYKNTKIEKNADVIIYNTCSVRESAENRIFGRNKILKKLKEQNSELKTILTGCMMHHKEEILKNRLPHMDHFLSIKNIATLPNLLGKKIKIDPAEYLSLPPKRKTTFRTWIPISYGCNNFCTYCIVPFARGKEYSRPVKEILEEVKEAVKEGAKEIWLLGQNVNSYGLIEKTLWEGKTRKGEESKIQDGRTTFASLLREVNKIPGNFWIRYTSAHPKDFSDDLILAMAECNKFPKYINLPVQSGDNKVLSRMNRNYTREHFIRLVKKIRAKIPGVAISTDSIVGFSGETHEEFKNTIKLYQDLKFDMAFIAQYSERQGTAAAAAFKDDIPHDTKEERRRKLTKILEKTALENNQKLLNVTMNVLIDEEKDGRLFSKSPENKTVEIIQPDFRKAGLKDKKNIGDFVKVKITDIGPWKLTGELIA